MLVGWFCTGHTWQQRHWRPFPHFFFLHLKAKNTSLVCIEGCWLTGTWCSSKASIQRFMGPVHLPLSLNKDQHCQQAQSFYQTTKIVAQSSHCNPTHPHGQSAPHKVNELGAPEFWFLTFHRCLHTHTHIAATWMCWRLGFHVQVEIRRRSCQRYGVVCKSVGMWHVFTDIITAYD